MSYCMQCKLCDHCFPIIYDKNSLKHVIYGHLATFHLNEVGMNEAHKNTWNYAKRKYLD